MTENKATRTRESAIPLCLPNNRKWNPQTGKCIETGDERSSLYVVEEALDQLKQIEGKMTFSY